MWFNRDEKKARPVADSPEVRDLNGVSFLSPRDPQGGGTWMLANEFGVVVCLLNKWELDSKPTLGRRKSRGQLVWQMAEARRVDDLARFLTELENYPAFTLVGLSSEGERFWEWDGETLCETEGVIPLTSSSYCFEAVKTAREEVYATGKRGHLFHESQGEQASAFTVRMNRPDAQTWSRSHISIGEKITWEYLAEQPNLSGESSRSILSLPLR